MFKIVTKIADTLKWPVSVELPTDGGKTRRFEFTGIFRRLSADEKEAFAKELGLDIVDSDVDWNERFLDRVTPIMTGWEDVCDEDGKPVPYSREALRQAIRAPSGTALMSAINKAVNQFETGSKAKNL